jgi:hypothetical protein
MTLLLLLLSCSKKTETSENLPIVQGAKIETVQPTSVDDYYEAVGTVRARNNSVVAARIMGSVVALHVREGDTVRAGQTLIESRYHMRHCDVMDLLALYQSRAVAPLDEIAQLLGLPGKLGMDGSQVWSAFQAGDLAQIRNYCETDVVNTYLVFLRFQAMRGAVTHEQYNAHCELVRATLGRSTEPHWQEFLAHWPRA